MVLADLGRRINNAVNEYTSRTPKFDEKALDAVLKEIAMALLQVGGRMPELKVAARAY